MSTTQVASWDAPILLIAISVAVVIVLAAAIWWIGRL